MITLKKALKLCEEMWYWLADHPDKEKFDWPGFEIYGDATNACWMCQYTLPRCAVKKIGPDCSQLCPLKDLWGNNGCASPDSPYNKYSESKLDLERTKYALKIANYCTKLLKEEE